MLVDVLRGTQTEIDAINGNKPNIVRLNDTTIGAIVREGERYGVGVDFNKLLCGLLSRPQVPQGVEFLKNQLQ
jgi:ketopantoate reductase